MGNLSGYDATQWDPNAGNFEPVPKNEYICEMTDSEFKENSEKTGEYLQCTWSILDGEYTGRRLLDFLNMKHPNDLTVKIANNTLSSICHAVGVLRPDDSSELHGKPALLTVDVEPHNKKPGVMVNRIKGYKPVNGSSPAATASTKTETKASGDKTPPWKRK